MYIKYESVKDAMGLFGYDFLEECPFDFYVRPDTGFLVASVGVILDNDHEDNDHGYIRSFKFVFTGNGNVEITGPDTDNISFTGIYRINGSKICKDHIRNKIKLIHGVDFDFNSGNMEDE